jgi:phosphomannomutase
MTALNIPDILAKAEKGVGAYLAHARESGAISDQQYEAAAARTLPNLREWLEDPRIDELSPNLKRGVGEAVERGLWADLVNAYRQSMRFGTGGIRGMMAFDRASIVRLQEEGLDAPILKGPNTLNNIVLLKTSAGVARFGKAAGRAFDRIVIGYDSRIRGGDFARIIAELFLAYGYTVYLFDEPCPYPEVTFAIPYEKIKAHVGILISASHNDYRYNGYKLSCGNGSQFDPAERDTMYDAFIARATTADIRLCPLHEAPRGKLHWLGGAAPVEGVDYCGREGDLINVHKAHIDQMKSFLMEPSLAGDPPLRVGFCAFHGAGRKAVPRLLNEAGLKDIRIIRKNGLFDLNGLFPSFRSDPGHEQQPDPGDPRAAKIAIDAFKAEYPGAFESTDIVIGTDPDADRCGIVAKVPPAQRHVYGGQDWVLLPADDMWGLLVWYRLARETEKFGRVPDADKKFIVLSHTTTDAIVRMARKHGLGVVKTWVGFAALSAAVRDAWDRVPRKNLVEGKEHPYDALCHPYVMEYIGMSDARTINVGSMEQSNGFSLLGGPPPDAFSLGVGGHVRDKDGTFAGLLSAEVAVWAKAHGTTLFELVDKYIYLDPDIGLFVNHYEPDPLDGEYPGIEGDRKKISILGTALDLFRKASGGEEVVIGGCKTFASIMYRTGKYDRIYPPSGDFVFPDEGVRFFFSADRLSHLTVRPSGTGNSLRFHVQLHSDVNEKNLIEKKAELRSRALKIADDIRDKLGAPR